MGQAMLDDYPQPRIVLGRPPDFWSVPNPLPPPANVQAPRASPHQISQVFVGRKRKEEKGVVPEDDDDLLEGRYIVSRIEEHKQQGATYQFRVRWKNYKQETWEPFGKLRLNVFLIQYIKEVQESDNVLMDWLKTKIKTWKREKEKELYGFLNEK
jgi:hypothetical protein